MDRGGLGDQHTHTTHDYAKELQSVADSSTHTSMLAPQQHHPSAPPPGRLQDTEPWRGSSGFGLANLLNRPSASAASASGPAPGSSSSNSSAPALPKFSLPSLHTFGKPFQPELTAGSQHSILNAQSASPPAAPRALAIHTSDPATVDRKPPVASAPSNSAPSSPSKQQHTTPRKPQDSSSKASNSNSARRIAPAPADDEDNEPDDDLGGSIRGGRWTADEHERFLAGFRIHGHKWKRVQQVVRTRSVTQVRTHAQKYLLKVAKLKAEKKQSGKDTAGVSEQYLAGRTGGPGDSSSDAEQGGHTAPSSPDQQRLKRYANDANGHDSVVDTSSPGRTPSKKKKAKARHYSEQRVDVLDQEYIAAAATTLCFLMTQKIDSLFDSRGDVEADLLEPYDCYADVTQQRSLAPGAGAGPPTAALSSGSSAAGSTESRKRAYMHFLTESPSPYTGDATASSFGYSESDRTDAPGYAVEAKKLYS